MLDYLHELNSVMSNPDMLLGFLHGFVFCFLFLFFFHLFCDIIDCIPHILWSIRHSHDDNFNFRKRTKLSIKNLFHGTDNAKSIKYDLEHENHA